MKTLHESETTEDIGLLDRAWSDPETFLFLPDRTGLPEAWFEEASTRLPDALRTGHFALLSSGSTGQPKLIFGVKTRAEALARALHGLQDSEPCAGTVLALPLCYCYAFVNQFLWSRVMGRSLDATRGLGQPDDLGVALDGARDAMLCLVGAQVPLLDRHFPTASFPGIIRLHFAGGPFPQHRLDVVHRLFPAARIFNNYGCAEAMPRLTLRPADESDEGANIGRPLPGIEMTADENGRVLFRSPYSAVAFYDDDGLRRVTEEDWIPSGDLGEPIDGGCWRITGRTGDVFKRFGEKISLPRLLPTVFQVWEGQAAFYREQKPGEEEGHVLVLTPHPDEGQVREILLGFRRQHPRTHWPVRVESVDAFPLLPNGKVDAVRLGSVEARTEHWRQRSFA